MITMGIRMSQVEKLLKAQREFDSARPADSAGRRRAASVIGSAWRNATPAERGEFHRRLLPGGRAPRP